MIMGRHGSINQISSERHIVPTSGAVTTRETKGEGSDLAMAKARFISITLRGEVDMSARTQDN